MEWNMKIKKKDYWTETKTRLLLRNQEQQRTK